MSATWIFYHPLFSARFTRLSCCLSTRVYSTISSHWVTFIVGCYQPSMRDDEKTIQTCNQLGTYSWRHPATLGVSMRRISVFSLQQRSKRYMKWRTPTLDSSSSYVTARFQNDCPFVSLSTNTSADQWTTSRRTVFIWTHYYPYLQIQMARTSACGKPKLLWAPLRIL